MHRIRDLISRGAHLTWILALPNLEGNTVHLQDFRGKVVLLGFFTTA